MLLEFMFMICEVLTEMNMLKGFVCETV